MPYFCFTSLPGIPSTAANLPYFAAVRLRGDTSDPLRLSLSGKFSEVCLALEQLAARQAQARQA